MDDLSKKTNDLIIRDFEIEVGEKELNEKELFDMLCDQVAYMMEYRLDFLLSLMYRLDINEQKINEALSPKTLIAPNVGLAHLILERQKLRVKIKTEYGKKDLDKKDWEGWEF